ncbi:MAG: hypothetical protein Q8M65_01790 [Rhodoglobus sp.]|nr:hypothetical protein [Rhodoglobus sp.]
MRQALPRKSYQLGWIRVAVGLAARGTPPNAKAIGEWISSSEHVDALSPDHGRLSSSAFDEPGRAARILGFLREDLGCTDLGYVLNLVETMSGTADANPFALSLPMRWVLWYASAHAERRFWRASLITWEQDVSAYVWLLAVARKLESAGAAGVLSSVLQRASGASKDARSRAVEQYGKPWMAQIIALGWEPALPRLRAWAETSPEEWTEETFWDAFRVAEQMSPQPILPSDLKELLRLLPPTLRGLDGHEADVATVQVAGVAVGLIGRGLIRWYGESWRRLLEQVSSEGIYLKSGSDSKTSNLGWYRWNAEDPVASLMAVPAIAGAGEPEPEPKVEPESKVEPGEHEVSKDITAALVPPSPSLKDLRARSWLRLLAWWWRGPSVADILIEGHDSWPLVHWTCRHWLDRGQEERWARRRAPLILGKRQVHWLGGTFRSFGAVFPGVLNSVLAAADPEYDHQVLRLALRKVGSDIEAPRRLIEDWVTSGAGEWSAVSRATIAWAANCIERHRWSESDILAGLRQTSNGTAEEALQLLGKLCDDPTEVKFTAEYTFAVVGDIPPGASFQVGGVDFFRRDPSPPFEILGASLECSGHSIQEALSRSLRAAGQALLGSIPGGRVLLPGEPTNILDSNGRPPRPRFEPVSVNAGVGEWWRSLRWFERRRPRPPAAAILSAREKKEFGQSRQHESAAERLLGLWVALEHRFENGDSGRPVIDILANVAAVAAVYELRRDVAEIADLFGHAHPPMDASWSAWAQWQCAIQPECDWAAKRTRLLSEVLNDRETAISFYVTALSNAAWLLSSVYSVRNRRVHEAYLSEDEYEMTLRRLDDGVCALLGALFEVRGDEDWSSVGALFWAALDSSGPPPKSRGVTPPFALLDEIFAAKR